MDPNVCKVLEVIEAQKGHMKDCDYKEALEALGKLNEASPVRKLYQIRFMRVTVGIGREENQSYEASPHVEFDHFEFALKEETYEILAKQLARNHAMDHLHRPPGYEYEGSDLRMLHTFMGRLRQRNHSTYDTHECMRCDARSTLHFASAARAYMTHIAPAPAVPRQGLWVSPSEVDSDSE